LKREIGEDIDKELPGARRIERESGIQGEQEDCKRMSNKYAPNMGVCIKKTGYGNAAVAWNIWRDCPVKASTM
jgi:hypothetical protein